MAFKIIPNPLLILFKAEAKQEEILFTKMLKLSSLLDIDAGDAKQLVNGGILGAEQMCFGPLEHLLEKTCLSENFLNKCISRAYKVTLLKQLMKLTPRQFESAMAILLGGIGYTSIKLCGGAGDLCCDILCVNPQGQSTMIQCKRYTNKNYTLPGLQPKRYKPRTVTSPELQQFIGMRVTEFRTDCGLYISTTDFTKPAKNLGRKYDIELWNGEYLANLLLSQEELQVKTLGRTLQEANVNPKRDDRGAIICIIIISIILLMLVLIFS